MIGERLIDRYPPWSEKRFAPGVSFAREKRMHAKRDRAAVRDALRHGTPSPPRRPHTILWNWL